MTVHSDELNDAETISHLRASVRRLSGDLAKVRAEKREIHETVYSAIYDAASAIRVPDVPSPLPDTRPGDEEYAIAVWSDWQLGKVTDTYDAQTCADRIALYVEKMLHITDLQRMARPIRHARLYVIGDMVEGEGIFPGQSYSTDLSVMRQACEVGPEILANAIRRILTSFDTATVYTCVGNHGRVAPRNVGSHPESNFDSIMYQTAKTILRDEPRVTWGKTYQDNEHHWMAMDQIGRYKLFMVHGDQMRGGFAGFPWYSFGRSLPRWATAAGIGKFDYSFTGHFHTSVSFELNELVHYGNGTVESGNEYAREELKATGRPSQWLLFCSPTRGITSEYRIWLDEVKAKKRRTNVKVR